MLSGSTRESIFCLSTVKSVMVCLERKWNFLGFFILFGSSMLQFFHFFYGILCVEVKVSEGVCRITFYHIFSSTEMGLLNHQKQMANIKKQSKT